MEKTNKSNVTEDTKTTENTLIIEGTVISAYIGKSRFSNVEKCRLAIESKTIPYDKITAFKELGTKFTPAWFKDKNGYMNLASLYNIPVKDSRNREISFSEFVELETAIGSKIKLSVVQRDGAIYPKAFKVIEDGEPRDPFEEL